MQKIAIIDIGSNSIRIVLVKIGLERFFKIVYDHSEQVRLEEGMEEDRYIKPARIQKAIKTLNIYRKLCDQVKPDRIVTVATEAVRRAANQKAFLARVKKETGFEIQVLSGEEEAFYDYLGVVNSLTLKDGLVMDIGGGSTELIWIAGRRIKEKVSLPIGSINLTQRFDLYDLIQPDQEKKLVDYLFNLYAKIPWLGSAGHERLIGIGGSFRNLGKIDRNLKNYPLVLTHNYRMNKLDLQEIYQMLRNRGLSQRQEIKGLSRDRADIIVGAAAAITSLVEFCRIKEITISGYGLREGLIYKHLCPEDGLLGDVLDYSINNSLFNYNIDQNHPRHVLKLLLSLCRQLKPLHGMDGDLENVLKTAAMLHDCGIVVRYYRHHDHSFYLILNSDINGLSHRELVMSAHIAASHGLQNKASMSHYRALIDKQDMGVIKKTGVLLKIATSLDQTMDRAVEDVECDIRSDTVIIKTLGQESAELEIHAALQVVPEFKKTFKKNLLIL